MKMFSYRVRVNESGAAFLVWRVKKTAEFNFAC